MISKVQTIISKWRASVYEQTQNAENLASCIRTLIGGATQTIFEPGCGTGKILFSLSQSGHETFGMDMDEHMLFYAAEKAALSPMRLINADILLAPWPKDFGCIVLASNLMHNLITDWEYKQAQKQLIMKSAGSLKKGGLLLLDFDCPILLSPLTKNKEICILSGTDQNGTKGQMYIKHTESDEKTRLLKTKVRYALTTKECETIAVSETFIKHVLTLEETTAWLYRAGFSIEALYGSHDFHPFDEKNRRCVIAARKE
ncbi:MAG: class I SAM-dependent methyltransferase [Clostridia bacterium]|nr:class I SAM-dependent methyltransferase [Clostridia bacterium]